MSNDRSVPDVWILRTGHGNGVHFGKTAPVENAGWKPYFSTPPAAQAVEVPDADTEQRVFEDWLESTNPSGDVMEVQRKWEASSEYKDLFAAPPPDAEGGGK